MNPDKLTTWMGTGAGTAMIAQGANMVQHGDLLGGLINLVAGIFMILWGKYTNAQD